MRNTLAYPAERVPTRNMRVAVYEGRSEINASYFIMLAHDVRGEYC